MKTTSASAIRAPLARLRSAYRRDGSMPLGGYLVLMGSYGAAIAGLVAAARATHRRPPRISAVDVAMMAVATFRISRLVTKGTITSPLRAPFTRFEEAGGQGEVNERPRGSGLQHAVGELASCPFCASVWTATGLAAGMVFAPRVTRCVAATATAVAGADFLQLAWADARRGVE